ncbi:MAG: alpha/beta hydrolase-fold protein [Acidobacteriota bacterium]
MKIAALLLMAAMLLAQGPQPVRSPEVHPDRSVTFRLRAPQATLVELTGEVVRGKGPQAMTKGSDGVWSLTVGPLTPEIWIYNFRVQGVELPDPSNISLMPRAAGTAAVSSFVEIRGDGPLFYDARPVPHGDVRMLLYPSKTMGVDRYLWVYTPPGYDKSNTKYPAYYLLHGNGETQNGWVMNGRANIILDNLIADGKAQPMIVVMPHGHPVQSASVGPYQEVPPVAEQGLRNYKLFTKELLEEILPMIEKTYRVYPDADHRALGGLSMGAMQSVAIGLAHPELFHYVLAYSGGFGSLGVESASQNVETQAPWQAVLANPADGKKLRLLFLGCGQDEAGLLAPGKKLASLLKEKGVRVEWADHPGGHVFSVWRNHLNQSAPLLFRK